MSLTPAQQRILRAYLDKELTYKETYNELYDHISSGLEDSPQSSSFEVALKTYVAREFGGPNGLHLIEKQYRATVITRIKKQYSDNIRQFLRFPNIIVLVVFAMAVYIVFSTTGFNTKWYFMLAFVLSLTNNSLKITQYYRASYWKKAKASVKYNSFAVIKFVPVALLALISSGSVFIAQEYPGKWLNAVGPVVATLTFVIYAAHLMVFYKLYRAEFKVDMAK
jgi:hypothetical protein